jgi:predicted DCC family thiol-disulfide oxidoreductase YuxK
LCNAAVRFVCSNDPAGRFRFASLQSAPAARLLARFGRDSATISSIILIDEDGLHERSTAALRIARGLRRPWSWLGFFERLPVPLRDPLYEAIARNRYRWFGRRDACAVPDPAQRARFLADDGL